MIKYILIVVLLLSGCARHASINYLYPEFANQFVMTTEILYIDKVIQDDQVNHPNNELILPNDDSYARHNGGGILLPIGTRLFLDGFYTHDRFTDNGTEAVGWTIISNKKIKFFVQLNSTYGGLKKIENLPWMAVSNITKI